MTPKEIFSPIILKIESTDRTLWMQQQFIENTLIQLKKERSSSLDDLAQKPHSFDLVKKEESLSLIEKFSNQKSRVSSVDILQDSSISTERSNLMDDTILKESPEKDINASIEEKEK